MPSPDAALRLRALVDRFYRVHADSFSATRERPWRGWERLLPWLRERLEGGRRPLRVLDAGCGNGRFGRFVVDALGPGSIDYHGVDASPRLVELAVERLADLEPPPTLAILDLLDGLQTPGTGSSDALPAEVDLVALMGVLHHVPGEETRADLLRRLGERLAPEGRLVATVWRPDASPSRVVAWEDLSWEDLSWEDLSRDDLPRGPRDLLLSWRGDASIPRYCHVADDAEIVRLVDTSGLEEVGRFEADGRDGLGNLYVVLSRS